MDESYDGESHISVCLVSQLYEPKDSEDFDFCYLIEKKVASERSVCHELNNTNYDIDCIQGTFS